MQPDKIKVGLRQVIPTGIQFYPENQLPATVGQNDTQIGATTEMVKNQEPTT
jgi:hypothetical protein